MFRVILFLGVLILNVSCSSNSKNEKESQKQEANDTINTKAFEEVSDCQRLKKEAAKMDSILLKTNDLDKALGFKANEAFLNFAHYCNADSAAPIFLIKTAQVSSAIQNFSQARVALETCIKDYPQFKNRPAAIFLLGQLYDEATHLNNEIKAKELYQQLLKEYPDSDWAASAKGAIALLGKSDEAIIKQFEKKK
jgi:TolA-binding protein